MKKLFLLLILLLFSATQVQAMSAQTVLDETNKYREKHNLEPVNWNSDLARAAELKAHCIQLHEDFAHEPRDYYGNIKCTVERLLRHVDYPWGSYGENLAMGDFEDDGKKLVKAWYESPGHRANLLSENHTELGVGGVEEAYFLGKETNIYVQEFGSPGEYEYTEKEPGNELRGVSMETVEAGVSAEPIKMTWGLKLKLILDKLMFWR